MCDRLMPSLWLFAELEMVRKMYKSFPGLNARYHSQYQWDEWLIFFVFVDNHLSHQTTGQGLSALLYIITKTANILNILLDNVLKVLLTLYVSLHLQNQTILLYCFLYLFASIPLTHWGLNKILRILQAAFANVPFNEILFDFHLYFTECYRVQGGGCSE